MSSFDPQFLGKVLTQTTSVLCTWQVSLTTDTPTPLIPAWASGTAYLKGEVVTNDSGKVYRCITAGTTAGSGGPTGTGDDIADNTAHWAYVPGFTQGCVVTNTDAYTPVYWGTDATITTSKASDLIPVSIKWPIPGGPEGIYVVAGASVTITVAAGL